MAYQLLADRIWGGGVTIGDTTAGLNNALSAAAGQNDYTTIFPAQHAPPIVSDIVEPIYETGLDFRITDPDAPSIWQTGDWANQGWFDSPFESNFAVSTVRNDSIKLADSVSATKQGGVGEFLGDILDFGKGVLGQAKEVRSLVDEVAGVFGWTPREPIPSGESGTERNLNQEQPKGADVVTFLRGAANAIVDQVKGLFNLGYDQQRPQAAFPIRHEIDPSNKTVILVGLVVAALVLFMIFGRK